MKIKLNDLISKVANVTLSTILMANGIDDNTATNAGNIIEGLVSGISLEGNNNTLKKLLSIYRTSIEAAFEMEEIELTGDLEEDIYTQLIDKENLLTYLNNDADQLIVGIIKNSFEKHDIPYEEQKINVNNLVNIIVNKIYKGILGDIDLTIIYTNIIVNVINEKIVKLESLNQRLMEYFCTVIAQHDDNISKYNQKKEFIEKWNDTLFLHKDQTSGKKPIKLCSLYEMPSFTLNNVKKSNIDVTFLEFLQNEQKRLLTILGNPGLGKSSLMCYFADKYYKYSNFIFIKLHELDTDKARNSLIEAITDFLGCRNRDLRNKVLFLDGYDELRVDNHHYELCLQLISEIYSIPGLKVAISSRLNYIDLNKEKYQSDFAMADTIELKPFNKDQMIKFIKKYNSLMENKSDITLLNQFRNISTEKEIFGIPFILYLICSLNINITSIQNIFNIYDKVFAFNGGLYDKIYDPNSGHFLTRNPENKRQLLEISELFAFEMFKCNDIELSMDTAQSVIETNYPKRKDDFAIGNYYNIEPNRIMFVHRTFNEYFLCKYIIRNIEKILIDSSDNEEIMCRFWHLFHENYIYKRLENLLELAISERRHNMLIITRLKESCQYILENFLFLASPSKDIETMYCELQNFLSSICKVFKLYIGAGWVRDIQIKNTYWKILLKCKGYAKLDLEYISLNNTDISGTVLRGNLTRSLFSSCNMCRVDIKTCNAEKSKWTNTDIKLSYADKAKLNYLECNACSFDLSNMSRAEVCNSIITNTTFNLIIANHISFESSIIDDVDFIAAILANACFVDATLIDVSFKGAGLEHANFSGAKLNSVDFSYANLRYAYFVGADFREVRIKETKMEMAIVDEKGFTYLIHNNIEFSKNIRIAVENRGLMLYEEYMEWTNNKQRLR